MLPLIDEFLIHSVVGEAVARGASRALFDRPEKAGQRLQECEKTV